MSTDVPLGTLQMEEESWDPSRLRDMVEQALARRRTFLEAAVEDVKTGARSASNDLPVPPGDAGIAYQLDTFVAADHRGHRLGPLRRCRAGA
ncbi:MAG: hypothetical protein ABJA87_06420 [bacterium]